jgi:hypothetical protein
MTQEMSATRFGGEYNLRAVAVVQRFPIIESTYI